ncbi:MAG: DnaJ C-terminal domain-containing protein [Patescibacteria group bacterium]
MKRDYYEILGVSKSTSDKAIKSAYRKLALEWHPDRNKTQEAEKKFKEINEAYEVLRDPKKKQTYDEFGHSAFSQGSPGGGNPFDGFGQGGPFRYTYTYGGQQGENPFGDFGFSDPFEVFEQFFGFTSPFGRQQRQPQASLQISFLEAYKGVEKEVQIDGRRKKIKIPRGVEDGQRIRFPEFLLNISVRPDKNFQRSGDDLFADVEVDFFKALAGGELDVPTPEGKLKIRIKPGTQPGTVLRLSGKGMPNVHGGRAGDLYARLQIDLPKWSELNEKQKRSLEDLAKKK